MIFILLVVVACCYFGVARLVRAGRTAPRQARRHAPTGPQPVVVELGEQTWTALDDRQLTRLLEGESD